MAVMDYRTRDGVADYGFSIEFQSDLGWRIYIAFRSCYQDHDERMQSPYQAIDHNGRCYVNWPVKLDSLGDARTVAALWAEIAQRYQYSQKQGVYNNEKLAEGSQLVEHSRADAA